LKKICFVILHYVVVDDTIECIESIFNNINYQNYNIVVVDNKSSNRSGIILKDKYEKIDNVTIILNNENSGFAKGNNIGYRYAKTILKAEFIILINNDTIIKQNDFIDKICNIYNETKYYILGPNIISMKNNLQQNPQISYGLDKKEIKKLIVFFRYTYLKEVLKEIIKRNSNNSIINILKVIKKRIKLNSVKSISNKWLQFNLNHNLKQENVKLHGSCLIFSPLFIKACDNALYSETFMYMEEDILYYICWKNNYKTIYDPNIIIYHKEDIATDEFFNSSFKKRKFCLKNSIKSAKILYKIMDDCTNKSANV